MSKKVTINHNGQVPVDKKTKILNVNVPGGQVKTIQKETSDRVGTVTSVHETSPMSNRNVNTSVLIQESNTISNSNKKEDTTSLEAKGKTQMPNIQDIVESAANDSTILRKEDKQ